MKKLKRTIPFDDVARHIGKTFTVEANMSAGRLDDFSITLFRYGLQVAEVCSGEFKVWVRSSEDLLKERIYSVLEELLS